MLFPAASSAGLCARYAAEIGYGEAQDMADALLSTLPITDDDRLKVAAAGLEVPLPASWRGAQERREEGVRDDSAEHGSR